VPSTIERLSETSAKLTITVPFAELKPHVDKAYQDIAGQVSIAGFRKGKVPRTLIDQRYGRAAVLQEAINAVLPGAYEAAIAEQKITPLGQPDVDVTKLEDDDEVEFTALVDVRPDFDLPDFATIKIDVTNADVTDEQVNERVELLRQRFATYSDVERAAKKGDYIIFDLSAAQGGKELEDSQAHGMTYQVGTGGLIDGLDEAVKGLKAGESKTFSSKLVGGLHKDESADITITVSKVQKQDLPEVDAEFAGLVSEYDTAEEMIAGLRDSLERMARLEQASQARDKALDAVIDATKFPLPENMVSGEVEARKEQITEQLSRMGMSIEDYLERGEESTKDPEEFWADMAKHSERAIRAQIILDKIAEERAIPVSQEDLTAMLLQKAEENGSTPDEEAKHMVEHGHMAEWLGDIRRGKAVGLIVNSAKVVDANGKQVNVAGLRSDGTYAEPEVEAEAADGKSAKTDEPKAKKTAAKKPKKAAE
jgi:trigger factor